MLDFGKLGVAGGIGALLGIILASWVDPETNGGFALLLAIAIIVCMTIGGIISKLSGRKKHEAPTAQHAEGAAPVAFVDDT